MELGVTEILREKDLLKASAIFEVTIDTLKRMNEQGLLNVPRIRGIVMRQDFLNYKRHISKSKGKFGESEILVALSKEYGLSIYHVRNIVYRNYNGKMCFCKMCGVRISISTAKRTGGVCTRCNAESLPQY